VSEVKFFNAIGFTRGVKGDGDSGIKVNGLEAVLGSRAEEEVVGRMVQRCVASSRRR
jgi:hypothetical protein